MAKPKKRMTDARAVKILRDAAKALEKGGYVIMDGQVKSDYVESGVDKNAFTRVLGGFGCFYLVHGDDLESGEN